jgi:Tfp pilus assembly protein PilF
LTPDGGVHDPEDGPPPCRSGDDDAAKHAYLGLLRDYPSNLSALNELAALAIATGHRSAARTACEQAIRHHPADPLANVQLGNLLLNAGDIVAGRRHFQAAIAGDPHCHQAHQGLACALAATAEDTPDHWRRGFDGHAMVHKPYRGRGAGIPIRLLVSVRDGNIPTHSWLDDRTYDITSI